MSSELFKSNADETEALTGEEEYMRNAERSRVYYDLEYRSAPEFNYPDLYSCVLANIELLKKQYPDYDFAVGECVLGDAGFFSTVSPGRIPPVEVVNSLLSSPKFPSRDVAWTFYQRMTCLYDGKRYFTDNKHCFDPGFLVKALKDSQKEIHNYSVHYENLRAEIVQSNGNHASPSWNSPETNLYLTLTHLSTFHCRYNALSASGRAKDLERDLFEY